MSSLNELADNLDVFADQLPILVSDAVKETATVIMDDLSQVTPVDVGQAVSNWQASLDAPKLASIPALQPSPRGRMLNGLWTHSVPPEVTREANAPLARAAAAIIIDGRLPGQPVYLTNALPYIEKLNEGSSSQAPAGFVDRAVILGRSVIDKLRLML